ncbi:polysaccharide deacetylase family sporulation protein PdaB [Bacillus sp. FJAT-45037]|uniref:polysaccharide deacetylase family sporulation protein PdaB n=1 Tax=Bacillus sp. FJAT-45037 TaxID=2011007 RepID=UPI000C23E6E5|nr:polysaccharide deacetylase family sporulation protein PdaB [Bacillus sp. FJAT-45037]
MKFIWVFHAKRIKQLSLIVIAALFAAGFLYIEKGQIPVFSTSEGPEAFYRAETDDNRIALTFNISWGEKQVTPILNVLSQKKVDQATFFLSASWAERYPDLVKQIKEEGHLIGSHGYQYKSYTSWEDEKVRKDLIRSQQILTELTGDKPSLLRPPNGAFDKRILALADKQNYSIVHWSVDSLDYQNPGVDVIVNNVMEKTSSGDILLFHASDSVKQTDKALPIIIDQLHSKGFSFISVEELMASTETSSEEIK